LVLVGSHGWGVWIHFGTEVAKCHERFGERGVFEGDSLLGGGLGAEELVIGEFIETQEFGAVEPELVGEALALHDDE
jgi:hypothetical protein